MEHAVILDVEATPTRISKEVDVDLLRFSGELLAHSRPAISNWTGLL